MEGLADKVVVASDGLLLSEGAEEFEHCFPAVKRRDEGLHQGDCPVKSTRVPPRLEIMRLGNMPGAKSARFIQIQPEVHAAGDFA